MSASVESWSWQCLCVCTCYSDFFLKKNRWRCIRWMFVVASVATIVRSPLTLRAVPRAATLSGQSGCSGVRLIWLLRLVRLVQLVRLVRLVQLVRRLATRVNADISVTCHSIDG